MTLESMTGDQRQIVAMIRDFVKREIEPVAQELDDTDAYPTDIMEQLKGLGLCGSVIEERYGGMGLSPATTAIIMEELAKGWMSIPIALCSHLSMTSILQLNGTEEQKQAYLPYMATGEKFGGVALTEPDCGSDLQAIRTFADRDGDDYVVNGTKTMITNGKYGNTFLLMTKTDRAVEPRHKGISCFIVEKGQGFKAGRHLDKLGFRGIDTTELTFEDYHTPLTSLVGMDEGQGFQQVMSGLEGGRIYVASSAVGVATAAFEKAMTYAQQRETMGVPISQHQAIQLKLADMYTRIHAARLMVQDAAKSKSEGRRVDLEASMAKLHASEMCAEVTLDAMRIFGGYGYFKENTVERYYRDAMLTVLGEGSNEIQRLVIFKNLLTRFGPS
jgi:alkylation response protein AidB-like acyl-CoA dehydrogenase